MKDKKEIFDDSHWRALAESLRSDHEEPSPNTEEPRRRAEVIRARFGNPPADSVGQKRSAEPRVNTVREPGRSAKPSGGMSRPELISHLRSALAKLEKPEADGTSQTGEQSAPPSTPDRSPDVDRDDTALEKIPASTAVQPNLDRAGDQLTPDAPRYRAKPTGTHTSKTMGMPAGWKRRSELEEDPVQRRQPPEPSTSFSQEVPDFLRSTDINWPSRADQRTARGAAAGKSDRLDVLYPSTTHDPQEAPPPWVRKQQGSARQPRRRLLPISVAAALVFGLASTGWLFSRTEALDSERSASGAWLNQIASAAVASARRSGETIRAVWPFGNDEPPIQSIVLLPSPGQQPSVRIPTLEDPPQLTIAPALPNHSAERPTPGAPVIETPTDGTEPVLETAAVKATEPAIDAPWAVDEPLKQAVPIAETTAGIVGSEKVEGLPAGAPEPPAPPEEPAVSAVPDQPAVEATIVRDGVLLPGPAEVEPTETAAPAPDAALAAPKIAAVEPPAITEQTEEVVDRPPNATESAALPAPPPDNWRVQLASLADGASPQAEWQRLREIHPTLLTDRVLHVERVELDRGTFFRVQAGDFETSAAAQDVCNQLKGRGQDCLVVR